jgi:hypothetical protein
MAEFSALVRRIWSRWPATTPTQDPHSAGSGYRHEKTHTNRCGSTSARADSGHVFTRFLNGDDADDQHVA